MKDDKTVDESHHAVDGLGFGRLSRRRFVLGRAFSTGIAIVGADLAQSTLGPRRNLAAIDTDAGVFEPFATLFERAAHRGPVPLALCARGCCLRCTALAENALRACGNFSASYANPLGFELCPSLFEGCAHPGALALEFVNGITGIVHRASLV